MARDADPPKFEGQPEPKRPYWQFPSLESRRWQQFRTMNARTGEITISRTCTRCGQFTIRRFMPGEEDLMDEIGRRFLASNRLPCEPDDV